jgi:hypothetical protein
MTSKNNDFFTEKVIKLEKEHNLNIGKLIICAKISEDLQLLGWVLPGGKFTSNKNVAIHVANKLNKFCYTGL